MINTVSNNILTKGVTRNMKQEIKIGVQGNDGTGDSIRDAFRKVNENFNEVYSIFGEGRITFSELADGSDYTGNQLIMGNAVGDSLTARTLTAGENIAIVVSSSAVTIASKASQLSEDTTPQIKYPFNVNLKAIGRVPEPSEALVDAFNAAWIEQTTLDQLPVNVGYANKTYLAVYNGVIGYKDSTGNVIQPSLTTVEGHLDTTSEFYDPALTGNYLSTSIVPRKDLVYRGGDTMSGPLYLNDHPNELAGIVGTADRSEYQAATSFYVDNKTFSSNVNLYVTTSGDDLQLTSPPGKEGRFWNYSFNTISAALLHAESLINVASQEPGPYTQRVSYSLGPNRYFSKIQKVTLTGGNAANPGYVAAFNLLQANKEFIQSETIAYINKKYVNSFSYDHETLTIKINSLLSNIGEDLVLGATSPDSDTSSTNYNSYWEGVSYIHDNLTSEGLIQWVETVNFVRDQIIDFSYNTTALQTYTEQIINALLYDMLFKTNYLSIQTGIAFKDANTKVSAEQLASMLTINPITITAAECKDGNVILSFNTQSSILFPIGSEILLNASFISKTVSSTPVTISSYNNGAVVSFSVIDSSTSSVTLSNTSLSLVADKFTVSGTIDRKNLINQLLLIPAVKSLPTETKTLWIISNVNIIKNYILNDTLPTVTFPTPSNPLVGYNVVGYNSAKQLLLENISFIQAETLSFLNSEYPTVIYDRDLIIRDVNYIIWSLVYDLTYGGNSQSVYIGKHNWATLSNFVNAAELEAWVQSIRHINILAQSIITNVKSGVTYQQSVRQYRNDTLTNGSVASTSVSTNITLIADITSDINNVPSSITYPTITIGVTEWQSVYTNTSRTIFTTGSTTSTSWFMNKYYPVIDTEIKQTKIIKLFKVITDIIESGQFPTTLPTYPLLAPAIRVHSVSTITPAMTAQARDLLPLSVITNIATNTNAYVLTTYSSITYDQTLFIKELKSLLIALCYDITFGGTTALYRASSKFTKISVNSTVIQNIFEHAKTVTVSYITGHITGDTVSNTVAALINSKFDKIVYFLTTSSATNTLVPISVFTNNDTNDMYSNAIKLKNLIIDNSSLIISNTISFVDTTLSGGFVYDESLCYRDIGLLVDAMSIDLITGGTWQAITSGKSFYKNSSARTVTVGGSHYIQSLDGIEFARKVGLQVLNKQTAVRFQSLQQTVSFSSLNSLPSTGINITGSTSAVVTVSQTVTFTDSGNTVTLANHGFANGTTIVFSSITSTTGITTNTPYYIINSATDTFKLSTSLGGSAITLTTNGSGIIYDPITKFTESFQSVIDILNYGISVAATPSYGTGLWHIAIDNGGNGYVEQGASNNNDLFPSKIVVGVGSTNVTASNAHGSIVKYISATDTSGTSTVLSNVDTLQLQLTTPGFFKIYEEIEFGEPVNGLNFTIFVESGIYYEDYPMRIPPNVTLKGDDARRTIVRPKDRASQSSWKRIFFYRDSIIDSMEIGNVNYTATYSSSNNHAPAIVDNISATLDNTTGSVVVTLSGNYQAPLSWIGLIFADNITSGFGTNLTERGRAVVDSVSGNTLNCTVIYPFSASGVKAAGSWYLFDSQNYGYHYLTNPADITSTAKNNKELDVFLCNEGVRIVGFTFQGHGGFIMVLDPTGNVKAKSPYIQECTSFAQSINSKRFAGAQFIDGFAGRLYGTLTAVADGGITVTVTGGSTSGLHLRPPQPPCSFYVSGVRYQIDQVLSHTINTTTAVSGIAAPNGTVVLRLDTTTPYAGATGIGINIETGGNRSMLANNLSMFNDLGYGVIVTNGGFSEQVCSFTYYAYTGYWANNGGNIRAVGCSNTFGKYGLRASGYDVTELPDSVSLVNNLVQTARVYKTGATASEMAANAINIWISDYDYIPTNVSELEINHITSGGTITQYSVSSVTTTSITVNSKLVLMLTLNTSGRTNSVGSTGLTYPLYHDQLLIIRISQNFKFSGIDNVKPTRPSTALQFVDKLNEVYRIGSYNLVDSLGTQLPANTSILQSDVNFSYYKFYTDTTNITTTDTGSKTCGSKIGDTKIAILALSLTEDVATINQLAKGTYIVAWNGRIHKVLSYGTTPVPHLLIDSTPVLDNASNSISSLTLTFVSTSSGTVIGSQYAVFSFASGTAPLVDTFMVLTGNARYSGTYQVTGSTTTSVTLYYPAGVGSSGTGTITASSNNNTGISLAFDPTTATILKVGYAANAPAIVTTRISTCRATGHDFCDIGTGSYSTTNIPYSIYGDPTNPRDSTLEVLEQGVGRCFYVSTNQDGIFRVGRFFSVDQGTGTVSFSSKIALTNVQGLGFDRGVIVSEFSADSSFNNNASDVVPVISAIRGYIDKRLGITHSGSVLLQPSRVGPGFVALNGSTPIEGSLAMQGNLITGLGNPVSDQDAATKWFVVNQVSSRDAVSKLGDVKIGTSQSAEVLTYSLGPTDSGSSTEYKWRNKTLNGDVTLSVVYDAPSLSYNLTSTIGSGKILNSMVSSSAAIAQSKLSLSYATTRASADGVLQENLGVASFNDKIFTSTSGWVDLVDSSSTSTGVLLTKLQYIAKSTILGNIDAGTGSGIVKALTPLSVVQAGDGITNSLFTSSGVLTVAYSSSTTNNVYSVTAVTTSASSTDGGKLVKTKSSGEIDVAQLQIDTYKIIDTVAGTGTASTAKVVFTTPGQSEFLTATGGSDNAIVVKVSGTLDVTGTNNSLKTTSITTGSSTTTGELIGSWTVPAGSELKVPGGINASGEGLTASSLRPLIKPLVLFDFANAKTLDPRITFARNSIGTYYNSAGILTTAIANQPRFNFNPTTKISEGLLVEESRRNWIVSSAAFATSGGSQNWTYTNVTRSTSTTIAPDGTTAYQFTSTSAMATMMFAGGTSTGPTLRTFSVWMKRINGSGNIKFTMDSNTPVVAGISSPTWYTIPVTTTLTRHVFTNATSDHVGIRIETSGDVVVIWGAQLEDGGMETSYIPTTTTDVLRAADTVYVDSTNFSRWYNQNEGTILISHAVTAVDTTTDPRDYGGFVVINSTPTSSMGVRCYSNGASGITFDAYSSISGSTQFDFTGLTFPFPPTLQNPRVNTFVTHALAYSTNSCSHSYNNITAEVDSVATISTDMIRLNIGNEIGTQTIAKIAYYPIRLSNTEIQTITTQ